MDLGLRSDEDAEATPDKRTRKRREIAPLLVHIGFHKCGSTWLQKDLFNAPDCGFTDATGENRQEIIMRFGMPDPLFYDPSAVASHYADALDNAGNSKLTLALSHEQLSGHPSAGGRDRCIIADRIHATFPEARILIVFREQRSLIRSMYSQHITAGGVESLRRWLSTPEPGCGRKPSFVFEYYEFDQLISYYRDLFGPSRILALPLELLSRDPQEFAHLIGAFCGHQSVPMRPADPRNIRRPQLMQLVQRPMNMFFFHNDLSPGALIHIPRFHNRWAKLRPIFDWISPTFIEGWLDRRQVRAIEEIVGNRYAKSNRRTAEITGLPLADFGYPVE